MDVGDKVNDKIFDCVLEHKSCHEAQLLVLLSRGDQTRGEVDKHSETVRLSDCHVDLLF